MRWTPTSAVSARSCVAAVAICILMLVLVFQRPLEPACTSQRLVQTVAPPQQQTAAASDSDYEALRQRFLLLVENAVTGSLYDELGACVGGGRMCEAATAVPFQASLRENGNDWPLVGHTMVGHVRLRNVKDLLHDVIAKKVPGDFAELGVWRGGTCLYAKALIDTHLHGQQRSVYLFDAFQTIATYGSAVSAYLSVSEAAVLHNFDKYNLMDDRVKIVKGMFKDTVPKFAAENQDVKFAVLRLDGNYYDSYQDCFYYLYEKLQVGGYLIMDDIMSHQAVRAAWEDFQKDQGFQEQLHTIDVHGAYFKKTKHFKVDMSKMKPPRDANLG